MDAAFIRDYSVARYLVGSIVTLCVVFIWQMLYNTYVHHKRLMEAAKKFPGPPTVPILGNSWSFLKNIGDSFEVMIKLSKSYPTARIWLGPKLIISVTNPEDIEIVLTNQETSKKSFVHEFMEPLVVNSLMNGYGPKMRAHRKFIEPLVNGEYMTNYIEIFDQQVRHGIDRLIEKVGTKEFDIYREIEYCVVDIAFESVLGIPGVAQSHGDLTMAHAVENFLDALYERSITPWLHPTCLFNLTKHGRISKNATTTIHDFIFKVIKEKRELHKALANHEPDVVKPTPSILDLWMENVIETNAMEDQEIAYDLITLFFGVHDTILGLFSFAILMLAMHPEIQGKVREEVLSIFETDQDITEKSVSKLNYTQMMIKETIRLFPVGPILPRTVTDDLQIGKYTLPKGSMVAIISMITHRSEKYWEEPEKFIPERFTLENSKDRHPFAYIPFSGGLRKCPGSKFGLICLKVLVAHFVHKCRFKTHMKLEDLKLKMHISVRSRDGYKISIDEIFAS